MTRFVTYTSAIALLAALLCSAVASSNAVGAEKKSTSKKSTSKSATAPKKSTSTKTAKKEAKPRGRLPAYYSSIVDDKQRTDIYKLQSAHAEKLTKLKKDYEADIKAMEAKLDSEIEDVLSSEQKKKLAELKAKRKSGSAKSSSKKSSKKG